MDVRSGPQRRLSNEELMLSNAVLEKTFENPVDSKEMKPVNPKGNPKVNPKGTSYCQIQT